MPLPQPPADEPGAAEQQAALEPRNHSPAGAQRHGRTSIPRTADAGLPVGVIHELEQLLTLAPQAAWQSANCSYGLVVAVLQASEQALRQAALHTSADQLQHLRSAFLRQRRPIGLEGEEPQFRAAQAEQLPRDRRVRKRRKLPRLRSF